MSLIRQGEEYLQRSGVPNARRNAEWMLCNALGCSRADLYLERDRGIERSRLELYRTMIERRAAREPLQYILESLEFMSLDFVVSPGVFIPRFETEFLVEKLIERASGMIEKKKEILFLDLCCGIGVIGISLARFLPGARGLCVDISPEAILSAKRNGLINGVDDRIRFVAAEAVSTLREEGVYDIITANPPYIPTSEVVKLPPEVRDYEPLEAIDGGADGMDFYKAVKPMLSDRVAPGGLFAFEIGDGQGGEVRRLLCEGWKGSVELLSDYNGKERVVLGTAAGGVDRGVGE